MKELEIIAPNVWARTAPLSLMGIQLGTRMSIVRLTNGKLWMHSPIELTSPLTNEINSLGEVSYIVCPNVLHHLYAKAAKEAYPHARIYAPHTLRGKRKDLEIDEDLSSSPPSGWAEDLEQETILGSMLNETVFYHKPSRTLIATDLVENFKNVEHLPTRVFLKLAGAYQRVGFSRPLRFLYRNRKKARTSIDRILNWPFERVIIAHGDVISENARDSIMRALAWLK